MAKKSTYEILAARAARAAKKRAMEEQVVEKGSEGYIGVYEGQLYSLNMGGRINPYSDNFTVHRGINLLADGLAQIPLRIYKGEDIMPEGWAFPDGFNLYYPSKDYTLYELIHETAIYYYLRGDWMDYINLTPAGKVYEIVPVNPKLIKIEKRDKETGRITHWKHNNIKELIPNEQLIYAKFQNPDGDRGLSPIEVVMDELVTDKEALEMNKQFFTNVGKIGGILEDHDAQLSKERLDDLVDQYNASHGGSANAHKTLGLPYGITYNQAMQTFKEMEFLQSRADIRDRVLQVLGIPKSVVGVTEKVDRAVAETALKTLWRLTIKPDAIRIQNKINLHLMREYYPDYHVQFDYSGIEELQTSRSEAILEAEGLRKLGYKPNEINTRLNLGMEEVEEDRDISLVPQNMIPLTDYTEPTDPISVQASVEDTVHKATTFTSEENIHNKGIARNWSKLQRKTERKFARKVKPFFQSQMRRILAAVRKPKAVDWSLTEVLMAVKTITNEDKALLLNILTPVYEDGSKEAIAMAQGLLNVSANGRVSERVVNQLTNRIVGVNDHTYNLIRREVVAAYEAGETIEQVSKRIQKVGKFNTSRSRLIARTESNTIISASTFEEYAQNNVSKKRWLTAGDSDVRETHKQNEDAGAIPINMAFSGTGEMYPGEPNCRCAIAPVVER